jgi:NAD(P)-dependent dehydrogenase (short-subunit alcohol dehydrogenase family)
MAKTIMITGASRGFGRIWAEAFLKRGDKVIATARNANTLSELVEKYGDAILPLQLDVNNRVECFDAVSKAKAHFGQIDVLINNAGYGLFGTVEETSEQQARDQFETNVFGLLWMTQAILPVMRQQQSGHIIQLSSLLGVIASPVVGLYTASKWAVEGLSESLAAEVKHFGIQVTILEPNGFATDWAGASAIHTGSLAEYGQLKTAVFEEFGKISFGKPEATTGALLQLVDEPEPPLRLFLGKVALPATQQVYAQRMEIWEEWKETAANAHGE